MSEYLRLWRFLLVVVALLFSSPPASALGVSPSTVTFSDVLPGGYAERPLMISSGTDVEPVRVDVTLEGPMASWIRLSSQEAFTLSSNDPLRLTVIVEPPPHAATGTLHGVLKVRTQPLSEGRDDSGMGVSVGIDVPLSVEIVQTSIARYGVLEVRTDDVTSEDPLTFDVLFANSGNVPVAPTLEVELRDDDGAVVDTFTLEGASIEPSREAWQSFSLEDFEANRDDYTAVLTFTVGNKLIAEKTVAFSSPSESKPASTILEGSLPSTTLTQKTTASSSSASDDSSSLFVPVAILLVIVVVFLAAATFYLARSRMPPKIKKPPSKSRPESRLGGAGGR